MRPFRSAVASVLILLAGARARSDYMPMTVLQMIGSAELIVTGSIATVERDVYEFTVEDLLYNEASLPLPRRALIKVSKFKNWSGAVRWDEYRPGQELVLFLYQVGWSREPVYRILSAGGEGEVPIEEGNVRFDARAFRVVKAEIAQRPGARQFKAGDFAGAIRDYRKVFALETRKAAGTGNGPRVLGAIGLIADQPVLEEYRSRSEAHAFLARVSLDQIAALRASILFRLR